MKPAERVAYNLTVNLRKNPNGLQRRTLKEELYNDADVTSKLEDQVCRDLEKVAMYE
jgi:hypothetical protein